MSSVVKSVFGGDAPGQVASALTPQQAQEQYAAALRQQQQQQNLLQALQNQGALQNQSDVYNQLQQVAQGQGPNPAQAMLNEATGTNVANQAALMASARGAASNPGLIARQAAMQGANLQQQAAGQAATLGANQQLNAINAAGNMANTQASNLLNQQNATGQQIANTLNTGVGAVNNANAINSQAQQANAAMQGQLLGNIAGAAGSAMQLAEGGEVTTSGPRSKAVQALHSFAEGGPVPALVSPGEQYLPPKAVAQVAQGANPLSVGERIPGQPKVKGDSYANDTVRKTLHEGGIVIPNSIMQSKDAEKKAAAFVREILARKRVLPSKK